MLWYILLGLLIIIILCLIIPIRVKIKYDNTDAENKEKSGSLSIFILYFVKVIEIDLGRKNKKRKDSKKNQKSKIQNMNKKEIKQNTNIFSNIKQYYNLIKILNDCIYIKKLDLNLGINTQDVIINAYSIAFTNSLINMYMASNLRRINMEKFTYSTYISDKKLKFNIDSIIEFKFVNNIFKLIIILCNFRKVDN